MIDPDLATLFSCRPCRSRPDQSSSDSLSQDRSSPDHNVGRKAFHTAERGVAAIEHHERMPALDAGQQGDDDIEVIGTRDRDEAATNTQNGLPVIDEIGKLGVRHGPLADMKCTSSTATPQSSATEHGPEFAADRFAAIAPRRSFDDELGHPMESSHTRLRKATLTSINFRRSLCLFQPSNRSDVQLTSQTVQRQPATAAPDRSETSRRGVCVESVSVSYDGVNTAVSDVSLDIETGSVVALLGPSGCGKTSLLRAIAGLERPTSGVISIGDRTVSGPDTWVKPERRNIGMVFQDGALFPHLSVADNIAFGLRSRNSKMSSLDRRNRVDELLRLVELDGLGDRLPETLSGGQQQRVALARSLAPNPSVLLLDEPFSALDAGLRVQVRSKVARILRDVGVTSIFVTHDQDEAFVLGDHVAVMRDGNIEQYGTPDQLYRAPSSPWVAGFVGEANFVDGIPVGDGLHASTSIGNIPIAHHRGFKGGGAMQVLVRPEEILLTREERVGLHAATVTSIEYYGHDVRYELELATGGRLAARTHPDVLFDPGDAVHIGYSGDSASAWPS